MVQNNIPAYQLQIWRNSHRGCYGPHGGFGCDGDPLFEEGILSSSGASEWMMDENMTSAIDP